MIILRTSLKFNTEMEKTSNLSQPLSGDPYESKFILEKY